MEQVRLALHDANVHTRAWETLAVQETEKQPRGVLAAPLPASAHRHCEAGSRKEIRLENKRNFLSVAYPKESVHCGAGLVDPGEERVLSGHGGEEGRTSYLKVGVAVEVHH